MKNFVLSLAALGLALGMSLNAMADDAATPTTTTTPPSEATPSDHPPGHHHGGGHHDGFGLGLCVGQTLAQQGVILPVPKPGQPPNLDAKTKAAFEGAMQTCHTLFAPPPTK